ncbi:MAG: Mpo1-like protein [Caldimonas sp.]
MRNATELLAQYAEYHRDRRNIVSHFVGVPMIVFGVLVILARPVLPVLGLSLTPAWLAFALAALWYLTRGDVVLGISTSIAVAVLLKLGEQVSGGSVQAWLVWGGGFFLIGWLIQFIGHWYEGRKPAFVDDMIGLVVAPMFVTAELMFMMGWNKPLLAEIERRAGPTHLRDIARIA